MREVQPKALKMFDRDHIEGLLSQQILAEDTELLAESAKQLNCLVTEFKRACDRTNMRVNEEKSKATVMGRAGIYRCTPVGSWDRWGHYGVVTSFDNFGNCFSSEGTL